MTLYYWSFGDSLISGAMALTLTAFGLAVVALSGAERRAEGQPTAGRDVDHSEGTP